MQFSDMELGSEIDYDGLFSDPDFDGLDVIERGEVGVGEHGDTVPDLPTQVGGGRKRRQRSATPQLTSTKLRPKVTPTEHATPITHKARRRRAQLEQPIFTPIDPTTPTAHKVHSRHTRQHGHLDLPILTPEPDVPNTGIPLRQPVTGQPILTPSKPATPVSDPDQTLKVPPTFDSTALPSNANDGSSLGYQVPHGPGPKTRLNPHGHLANEYGLDMRQIPHHSRYEPNGPNPQQSRYEPNRPNRDQLAYGPNGPNHEPPRHLGPPPSSGSYSYPFPPQHPFDNVTAHSNTPTVPLEAISFDVNIGKVPPPPTGLYEFGPPAEFYEGFGFNEAQPVLPPPPVFSPLPQVPSPLPPVPSPPPPVPSPSPPNPETIITPPTPDTKKIALDASPTVGRLSNSAQTKLADGFARLEELAKSIGRDTGLASSQVIERWIGKSGGQKNSWNIYQAYFGHHEDIELARLAPSNRPEEGALIDSRMRAKCWILFQEAFPDRYYEILYTWYEMHLLELSTMTVGARSREFTKFWKGITSLIDAGSNRFGFESVFATVGSVVNQDQGLAKVYTSGAAINFFQDRLRVTDDTLLGHFKAHVYNTHSTKLVEDTWGDKDNKSGDPDPDPDPEHPSKTSGSGIQLNNDIKAKFSALAEKHGIKGLTPHQFPWKQMPQIVFNAGFIIINWPEDVAWPCDALTGKGIAGIHLKDRMLLLEGLEHPTHPVSFLQLSRDGALPQSQAALIGVPPDADSHFNRGRRKFLDAKLTEDRKGPARKLHSAKTRVKPKAEALKKSKKADVISISDGSPPIKALAKAPRKKPSLRPLYDSDSEVEVLPIHISKPVPKFPPQIEDSDFAISDTDTSDAPIAIAPQKRTRSTVQKGAKEKDAEDTAPLAPSKRSKVLSDKQEDDIPLAPPKRSRAVLRKATSEASDTNPATTTGLRMGKGKGKVDVIGRARGKVGAEDKGKAAEVPDPAPKAIPRPRPVTRKQSQRLVSSTPEREQGDSIRKRKSDSDAQDHPTKKPRPEKGSSESNRPQAPGALISHPPQASSLPQMSLPSQAGGGCAPAAPPQANLPNQAAGGRAPLAQERLFYGVRMPPTWNPPLASSASSLTAAAPPMLNGPDSTDNSLVSPDFWTQYNDFKAPTQEQGHPSQNYGYNQPYNTRVTDESQALYQGHPNYGPSVTSRPDRHVPSGAPAHHRPLQHDRSAAPRYNERMPGGPPRNAQPRHGRTGAGPSRQDHTITGPSRQDCSIAGPSHDCGPTYQTPASHSPSPYPMQRGSSEQHYWHGNPSDAYLPRDYPGAYSGMGSAGSGAEELPEA